jgi:radical S-adenosyl methionine domain-containing protein 2
VASINFHLWQPCNMRCGFCFAQFKDVRGSVLPAGHLNREDALTVVRLLAEAGFRKVTFAGGEPFLCPWIYDLVNEANALGMVSCVVTNGSLLSQLERLSGVLDWLVISIDSTSERTLRSLGRVTARRALGRHDYLEMCQRAKDLGIQLKINTVVTRENLSEDLSGFVSAAHPARWKILQMLPVAGQNDHGSEALRVTSEEFRAFVDVQLRGLAEEITVVVEDNDAMTGSYAMLDPAGRFFDNTGGSYFYSESILTHGVARALEQVVIDSSKFRARGGYYEWRRGMPPALEEEAGTIAIDLH